VHGVAGAPAGDVIAIEQFAFSSSTPFSMSLGARLQPRCHRDSDGGGRQNGDANRRRSAYLVWQAVHSSPLLLQHHSGSLRLVAR